jgi:anti-sigma-K factor RskA
MNERDLLPDYVLGLLSPEEKQNVEKLLQDSSTARADLKALQQTFIQLSESVPAARPHTTFQNIQRRLVTTQLPELTLQAVPVKPAKPFWYKELREWRNYALAASLVLAVIGWSWGLNTRQEAKQTKAEAETINHWLAYGDLSMASLRDESDTPIGTVLVSPRDYALFILDAPPPAGKSYQAWGRVNDTVTSLAVAQTRLLEVNCKGFEGVEVSLEPLGGSSQPTQPLSNIPLN